MASDEHATVDKQKPLMRRYTALVIAITLVVIMVAAIWNYFQWTRQTKEQMASEARVFSTSVMATWDLIDYEQDNINHDADGTYDFKGIYCSLVGKSVGELFSRRTDYSYRLTYIRENPRNTRDTPDGFEQSALNMFKDGATESYDFATNADGQRVFRYVGVIYLSESCLECHGDPAGELDATGTPKEGMQEGDIAGAVSITMPLDNYYATTRATLINNTIIIIVPVVLVLIVSFIFFRKRVLHPVQELEDTMDRIGEGNLKVKVDDSSGTTEISDLARGVQDMVDQLDDLYSTLEDRVDLRTQQYRDANTQLERQQIQIERTNDLLKEANAKLKDENEYRSNIISILSHELRTPLTSILAYTDLLGSTGSGSETDDAQDAEYIAKIKKNCSELLEMANNVLDVAKIEAGRMEPAHEVIDFVDLMSDAEMSMEGLARSGDIKLTTQVDPTTPLVLSDWSLLRRVVANLLSNAIKFTSEGGEVEASVRYEMPDDDPWGTVVIQIKDTGIGIAAKDQPGIFDRFRQVDSSMTRRYSGSGLGLSFVKTAVGVLGGTVDVSSRVGKGSTFIVRIHAEVVDMSDEED